MKSLFRPIYCLLLIGNAFVSSLALAHSSVLIPIEGVDSPAQDLIYNGQPIDRDSAAALRSQGVDISKLNPSPNDMWGKKNQFPTESFPSAEDVLKYDSGITGLGKEVSFHRVLQNGSSYRLILSTVPHRALMARALLIRLGYNQDELKRLQRVQLDFTSEQEKLQFLDEVAIHTLKDPKIWIVKEAQKSLTLQDVLIESGNPRHQNYYWGALTSQFADGRRAQRALLVPLALTYFPENLDAAEWSPERILSEHLLLPFPSLVTQQQPFNETAIEDVKWISRRIAALKAEDWRSIVRSAQYPSEVSELVVQKLLSRRSSLLKTLQISHSDIPFNTKFSNTSVKNGQVIQAQFKGFASRFSYGASEEPLRPEELVNFGILKGFSSALLSVSSLASRQLQILSKDSLALKNQQKQIEKFFRHILQNPNVPYSEPLSSWGGPTAGFNVQVNRQIATGTAFGSSAPIQLVDSVTVGASLGYFRGLNGLKNFYPGLEAQLSLNRTFMRLQSLTSIAEAMKAPVQELLVPEMILKLGDLISRSDLKDENKSSEAIGKVLAAMKNGEILTITDTLTAGAQANLTVPLQALLPSVPLGFNQSLSFGAGLRGVVYKRTTLRRVNDLSTGEDHLQVSVQSVDGVTGNLFLDFNYYIRILRLEGSVSKMKAEARVYSIDAGSSGEQSPARALALKELFATNSERGLVRNFPYYQLRHSLHESNTQFSFLFFQSKSMEARHLLRIEPPQDVEASFDPKKFQRSFYTHRTLQRSGSDFFSFLGGIVSSLSEGYIDLGAGGGGNPAYTPYGSARWIESNTDAEITNDLSFKPVTVTKEVWAGWRIKKEDLFNIFDQVDQKLKALRVTGQKTSLIKRDAFAATRALEFYNITLSTVYYDQGLSRVLARLGHGGPTSFKALVEMSGGMESYLRICEEEKNLANPPHSGQSKAEYWYGATYPCLTESFKRLLHVLADRPKHSSKQARVEWQNRFVLALQQSMSWFRLSRALGKDGYFLQLGVKGFRSGDHQARDSENDELISSYVSDSQGTIDLSAGAGALAQLSEATKISLYELGAQYLTGGD